MEEFFHVYVGNGADYTTASSVEELKTELVSNNYKVFDTDDGMPLSLESEVSISQDGEMDNRGRKGWKMTVKISPEPKTQSDQDMIDSLMGQRQDFVFVDPENKSFLVAKTVQVQINETAKGGTMRENILTGEREARYVDKEKLTYSKRF